jgi:hypothetical protein
VLSALEEAVRLIDDGQETRRDTRVTPRMRYSLPLPQRDGRCWRAEDMPHVNRALKSALGGQLPVLKTVDRLLLLLTRVHSC